jgi:hypothetical protein
MDHLTPSDFTIIVKNIPLGLEVNYHRELLHIFTYNAVEKQETKVSKIVLVYDIDYLIELEANLSKAVKRK